jgi:hypothetical protein
MARQLRIAYTLGEGVCSCGLAGACVLPDEESFSSGARTPSTNTGHDNEMVLGNLHATIQCTAPLAGAFVCRALRVPDIHSREAVEETMVEKACGIVRFFLMERSGFVGIPQAQKRARRQNCSGEGTETKHYNVDGLDCQGTECRSAPDSMASIVGNREKSVNTRD